MSPRDRTSGRALRGGGWSSGSCGQTLGRHLSALSSSLEETVDFPRKVPFEALAREGERGLPEASVIEAGLRRPLDGGGEPGGGVVLVENSVDPGPQDVGRPAPTERHHRRSAGERLDRGDAEILLAGLDEDGAGPVERAELLGRKVHGELYGGPGQSAEARLFGTPADQNERTSGEPGRLDRDLVPLVLDEGANSEEIVFARRAVRSEEVRLDGRMADPRLTAVMAGDPIRPGRRAGEIPRGAPRGRHVPAAGAAGAKRRPTG